MTVLDIGYKEYKAQKKLYTVRFSVSPLTQESDIVATMDPLFDRFSPVSRFDKVIFATRVPDLDTNAVPPDGVFSCFPELIVLVTASEQTSDLVMEGLVTAKIFGVDCNPVWIS